MRPAGASFAVVRLPAEEGCARIVGLAFLEDLDTLEVLDALEDLDQLEAPDPPDPLP